MIVKSIQSVDVDAWYQKMLNSKLLEWKTHQCILGCLISHVISTVQSTFGCIQEWNMLFMEMQSCENAFSHLSLVFFYSIPDSKHFTTLIPIFIRFELVTAVYNSHSNITNKIVQSFCQETSIPTGSLPLWFVNFLESNQFFSQMLVFAFSFY